MSHKEIISVRGERALRDGDNDRLGFGEVAARIATALTSPQTKDGMVVGLNGKWGAGKSSLLYLVQRQLLSMPEESRPTVINFRPWLIGNRDALLATLFGDLADAVSKVNNSRGDIKSVVSDKAGKAAERLRKFGSVLSRTGSLISVAGAFYPGLGLLGDAVSSLAPITEEESVSLTDLKDGLIADLKALDHRIIVTIDDVDRLEPQEILEILRLVRSVADFPNVIYLLCYDADILAESIQAGAKVADGAAFLEKIVQLTVMVPIPEAFQLRQWFALELEKILGAIPENVAKRLLDVIDQEGGRQLRTPRSVSRTLDSIRFVWAAVSEEGLDAADLVWLQLIKDGAPKFYRWVETYLANVAATSFGTAMMSESNIKQAETELLAVLNGSFKDYYYCHSLSEILPSVVAKFDKESPSVKIFQNRSSADIAGSIHGRRLASPDHYKLYFSVTAPGHAISREVMGQLWHAADVSSQEVADLLIGLHNQKVVNSLRKTDVLFERLRFGGLSTVSENQAKNMIMAFGSVMDDFYRIDPQERFFVATNWERAERLLPLLLEKISESAHDDVIRIFASTSPAISFLTSIFRAETFSHGIYGDQKEPEEKWLLTKENYERFSNIMLARYRDMSFADMMAAPRRVQILYAWKQGGDEKGVRKFVTKAIKSDLGFVEVLEGFVSRVTSSDAGEYNVLKGANVEPYVGFDNAQKRLAKIISKSADSDVVNRAIKLLDAVKAARGL